MKQLFSFLLLLLLSISTCKIIHELKDGFSIRRVQPIPLFEERTLPLKCQKALAQPFKYLGRGRQCFAFESEDGKYVLKLPRTEIFTPPVFAKVFPKWSKEIVERREKRRTIFLRSLEIAFQKLPDQTALLALHLGQNQEKGELLLTDQMGFKHTLKIGKTAFILQEKKDLLIPKLLKAREIGDLQEVKKILHSWAQLIVERSRRGVENRDSSFLKNYGYDGQKTYQIDIGSFNFKDPAEYRRATTDCATPIQAWLKGLDTELYQLFSDELQKASQ